MAGTQASVLPQSSRIAELLRDPDLQAIPLTIMLLDVWGQDLLDWSAATILLEAQDDFGVVLSQPQMAKLLTVRGIMTSNDFTQRPYWFIQSALALDDGDLHPEWLDLPSLPACAWALTQAQLIDREEVQPKKLGQSVRLLLKQLADWHGLVLLPEVLRPWLEDIWNEGLDWTSLRTDDPTLFEMAYRQHLSHAEEIDHEVYRRLVQLLHQLARLPVVEADLKSLKMSVLNHLEQLEQKLQSSGAAGFG